MTEEKYKNQLELHEQLSPIRDRVSRVEATIEYHEKELKEVKTAVVGLREKMEVNHKETMSKMDGHNEKMISLLTVRDQQSRRKDDEVVEKIHKNDTAVKGLKSWIIGLGVGLGALLTLIEIIKYLNPVV